MGLTADTARKIAFAGVCVNVIVVLFLGVGTIVQFLRFQSLLTLRGADTVFSWVFTVVLFAFYIAVGTVLPVVALQPKGPGDWYVAPLILLVGGVVTVFSLGGLVLILAAALLFSAGPDEAYGLAASAEAEGAEDLRDQLSPRQPARACPICGYPLQPGQHTCPACARRVFKPL
jgi:hypothetical protein